MRNGDGLELRIDSAVWRNAHRGSGAQFNTVPILG
jgi:hypothetical protein